MSDHVDLLKNFDAITRGALCRILGSAISDFQWLQAKLPVPMGGLGLRAAEDHAAVAYACSLLASRNLVHGLLGKVDEEVVANVPEPVLNQISEKQGDEASVESLVGSLRKPQVLKLICSTSPFFSTTSTKKDKTEILHDLGHLVSLMLGTGFQ